MTIKMLVDEDFVNYKSPSMYIGTSRCGGKCCKEAKIPLSVCQNAWWRSSAAVAVDDDAIIQRYLSNDITQAICFAGLEPFEQFDELLKFLSKLRTSYRCNDTVIVYTGYNEEEILSEIDKLKHFDNIIVKFGRYVPNQEKHFDKVLGVSLASDNQYAKKIS